MLREYNERLNDLREKIERGSRLDAMLRELKEQETALAQQVGELSRELFREQADVDRLTGGFWSIYYAIVGKKADMLEKERAEALKASVKYETAKAELQRVQAEIDKLSWDAGQIRRYEREYQETLAQKLEAMKVYGVRAQEISDLEEKKRKLETELREIGEAMSAGSRAMSQIERIAEQLDGAEGYATWDTWFGGGLIADAAKHSRLDEAQQGVQRLAALLRSFRTELADISIQMDVRAQVDDGTKFVDVFFDNIFTDHAVLNHIHASQDNLRQTGRQVRRVMDQLRSMERERRRSCEKLESEIRALAERTQ